MFGRNRLAARGKNLKALTLALFLVLGCAPALAEDVAAAQRDQALSDLHSKDTRARVRACITLAEAGKPKDLPPLMEALYDPDDEVRRAAEQAIWRIWSRSGDESVDRAFEIGLAQMQSGELREAAKTFGHVIRMKPDFAEGWNKRATVYFLLGEDDLSLRDCDEVLKRNPQHFGVLAGYGQIYVRRGDLALALNYFERALTINPNMGGVRGSVELIEKILSQKQERFI